MRAVSIHDTLSGELRELQPREPGSVGIYACGPTTYGRIHIGNARPYVIFTLLKRLFVQLGYDAKLYDGSIIDWGQRKLPIKKGR